MRWLLRYPTAAIAFVILVAAPLVGWGTALYLTRHHYHARAKMKGSAQWLLFGYYSATGIVLLAEVLWPPALSSPAWWALTVVKCFLIGSGFSVAYTFVNRARKIRALDFSTS